MAVFDWMAPPQTYWTPPKVAEGSTKLTLAVAGYNSDGSKNTWGQIRSFLPLSELIDQQGIKTAKASGLTDVAQNIQAGVGETMAHSQLGTGLLVGAAGAIAGQPQVALKGGQMALGGLASTAALQPINYSQGHQSYY